MEKIYGSSPQGGEETKSTALRRGEILPTASRRGGPHIACTVMGRFEPEREREGRIDGRQKQKNILLGRATTGFESCSTDSAKWKGEIIV